MNFGQALSTEGNWTTTENGCDALKSTGSKLLDFYGTVGALRNAQCNVKTAMFEEAFKEDALSAMKLLFYCRDIRGGTGERKTFREILRYAAVYHPEAVIPNIPLIGLFGRYDDLYTLVGTPIEKNMWAYVKDQFEADIENMQAGKNVSLLAKWIKSPDSAQKTTRKLGNKTANNIGYSKRYIEFNKNLKALRKYIGIVEGLISTNQFDKIDYSILPGKAMLKYKNIFMKKDADRFYDFTQTLIKDENKVNTSALTPYDIVHDYIGDSGLGRTYKTSLRHNDVLEAAWRSLEDYVDGDFLVMCDTSGSMFIRERPAEVALSLAIYSAEHNKGQFHNKFITFSSEPEIQELQGELLADKLVNLSRAKWDNNTDIFLALKKICEIGVEYHIANEDMPKALLIVSDMQFDSVNHMGRRDNITQLTKELFREHGYSVPNIIYWNVDSKKVVFHASMNTEGVQLASGCNPVILKSVLESVVTTPYEAMMRVIESERYSVITI